MDNNDISGLLAKMLDGKEIPDNLKDVINSINLNSNTSNSSQDAVSDQNPPFECNSSSSNSDFDFSKIDTNTVLKIKGIMSKLKSEEHNPRANLLRSLKPYLNSSRQDKVEQYIQLLNMENIFKLFNSDVGDKK